MSCWGENMFHPGRKSVRCALETEANVRVAKAVINTRLN
jgi:hypothetical protein